MSAHALGLGVPLAEVTRRDERSGREVVESMHAGHLVVVGSRGEILASAGDPNTLTFVRSAAKPFQTAAALALLDDGGGCLTDHEVAVSWASHRGEPRHIEAVASLLERSGTAPRDLTCPPAVPEADPGAAPSRIQHNCSGKHAMFALAGAAVGTPRDRLLDPAGALQQHLLRALEQRLGNVEAVGTDGCGAPAVAGPLIGLAGAYAELVTDPAAQRVRDAAFAHPLLVGGEHRLESALLAAGVVAKVGAEGVYAAGWIDAGGASRGLAIKGTDGSHRGVAAVTIAVLEGVGAVPVGTWTPPPPLGGGEPVGRVRPTSVVTEVLAELAAATTG